MAPREGDSFGGSPLESLESFPDNFRPARSVVAGDALEGRAGSPSGVLLTVALDAPPHRQHAGSRSETDEAEEVVTQLWSGVRANDPHSLDRTVTGLTFEPEAHVGPVREEGELRNLEDSDPRDRLTALC